MPDDYEYRGLMAEAWDLLRGDTSGWPDRIFFRTLIERHGGPALDVGCGTGRLLLDYLAAGLDVDGIDNSPEMLALLRQKATTAGLDVEGRVWIAEMQRLVPPRRYRLIFVPSLSIQLLTDRSDFAAALAGFHAHLEPGGRLALSLSAVTWDDPASAPRDGEWSKWQVDQQARHPNGDLIRRWTRGRFHPAEQLLDEEFRYEVVRDGQVIHSERQGRIPTIRIHTQAEAVAALQAAGFAEVAAMRDDFTPVKPTARRFKLVAVRP